MVHLMSKAHSSIFRFSQTAGLKVFAFVLIIIVGLVIDLGGAPNQDRLGFRYWRGKFS